MPNKNREKQKVYQKKYWEKHKQYYVGRASIRRKKLQEIINREKDVPCFSCGIKYPPYVMDLHHTDPEKKEYAISTILTKGWSEKRLLEELKKCIVLCSNCHREYTHKAI